MMGDMDDDWLRRWFQDVHRIEGMMWQQKLVERVMDQQEALDRAMDAVLVQPEGHSGIRLVNFSIAIAE